MKKYDSYKDSGVEWIGEIPENWQVNRLKYIGQSIIGIIYSPDDVVYSSKNAKLVLRASNIQDGELSLTDSVYVNTDIRENQILKKGDILICSRSGSENLIGKNILIDEDVVGETFGAFMTVFRTDIPDFVYNYFNSQVFKGQTALFKTSTINQLTVNTLNNFVIALPPIEEQTSIASFLDRKTAEIDELIADKKRLLELYEEEKTAIINQAVTKGLDPNAPMKDSGIEWIGEIPSHWEIATVGRLCILGRGRVISAIEIAENEGVYPVYSSQTENYGIMGKINTYDFEGEYVTWTTDGANAGTVFYREGKFNCTNVCGTIQPKNWKQIDLKFLPYYLNLGTKFSVRLDINPKLMNNMMAKIPIVIPPKSEQTSIASFLDRKTSEIDFKKARTEELIELLTEYRTALISEAVTGKIKVTED
ncbi:MAG: restriction endonuclease subunit S [Tissierellia bacterium]|nr:restriction endonuclease subunit S [Tissierellia bacterium]